MVCRFKGELLNINTSPFVEAGSFCRCKRRLSTHLPDCELDSEESRAGSWGFCRGCGRCAGWTCLPCTSIVATIIKALRHAVHV